MTTLLMTRHAVSSGSSVKKSRLPSTSTMRLGLALLMMLPELLCSVFAKKYADAELVKQSGLMS